MGAKRVSLREDNGRGDRRTAGRTGNPERGRVALKPVSIIYEMCDLGDFFRSVEVSVFSSAKLGL